MAAHTLLDLPTPGADAVPWDAEPGHDLALCIERACDRIAPSWPLDRFIAVNPYWGFRQEPAARVAARWAVLAGSPVLMPRRHYREQWQAGTMSRRHLQAALDAAQSPLDADALIAALMQDDGASAIPRLPLLTDLADAADPRRGRRLPIAWREHVTQQIGQRCAAWFDSGQAAWDPDRTGGLYPSWWRPSRQDLSTALLMGAPGYGERLAALPAEPMALIQAATRALALPAEGREAYFTALLMSLNGWAACCAYRRWQARLEQRDDDSLVHLLAIRLAWECLLDGDPARRGAGLAAARARAWAGHEQATSRAQSAQATDWLWQAALERAYQETLCRGLLSAPPPAAAGGATAGQPALQAVFCIDVRSEVYRRALEAVDPAVQTIGFAGFFGLPIGYTALGGEGMRPQLPGLLTPTWRAGDSADSPSLGEALTRRRRQRLTWWQRWQGFRTGAASGFSFVESCGLGYAAGLLASPWPGAGSGAGEADPVPGLTAAECGKLRPGLLGGTLAARVALAAGILRAMGLEGGFARLLLLAGHGSHSANNPHAASLDCGACGGQSGEVNARVLAALLNDPALRAGLAGCGIEIPASCHVVAGLHDTVTDELQLFDLERLPASHAEDLDRLTRDLAAASARARAERAAALGLDALAGSPGSLLRALQQRGRDWAQTRPEWGLAGNASFIAAPRGRSRQLDLAGRAFLHDYDAGRDPGGQTLAAIMTAPMVVAHWINMQYHASCVDNLRYGSGNKLLHNVVGGGVGVFEGNGGDLRIGLPMQSLHDGERWRHTPLRLSVFIEASRAALESVIRAHDTVRQLVDNGWLHLFQIEPGQAALARYRPGGGWDAVAAGSSLSTSG